MASKQVRGLENPTGAQNCFLNVVLQAFWRLDRCRSFFLEVEAELSKEQTGSEPSDRPDNPLLHSLANLFTNYQYCDHLGSLPPTEVRNSLAVTYAHLDRFQQNQMDDASESFEFILKSMHGNDVDIDKPCESRSICLGHDVFVLDYLEQDLCQGCQKESEIRQESDFTFRVYAVELAMKNPSNLAQAIRGSFVACRKDCLQCHTPTVKTAVSLLSFPSILALTVVWPSTESTELLSKILQVLKESSTLDPADAFVTLQDSEVSVPPVYSFAGMICFYHGSHYVFFSNRQDGWYLIDDQNVRHVGSTKQMMIECIKAKYYPIQLFYESSSRPISRSSTRSSFHRAYANRSFFTFLNTQVPGKPQTFTSTSSSARTSRREDHVSNPHLVDALISEGSRMVVDGQAAFRDTFTRFATDLSILAGASTRTHPAPRSYRDKMRCAPVEERRFIVRRAELPASVGIMQASDGHRPRLEPHSQLEFDGECVVLAINEQAVDTYEGAKLLHNRLVADQVPLNFDLEVNSFYVHCPFCFSMQPLPPLPPSLERTLASCTMCGQSFECEMQGVN